MNKKIALLSFSMLFAMNCPATGAGGGGTAPGYGEPPAYDDMFDKYGNEKVPQEQESAETKKLREEVEKLKRKEAARETKETIESFLALFAWYKQSLQNRWDKPETQEQYHKLIDELNRNIQNTADPKTRRVLHERLKEVASNSWKNGWCSRNPFKCDMCKAGGVIVTLSGIVYFVGGNSGGGQG